MKKHGNRFVESLIILTVAVLVGEALQAGESGGHKVIDIGSRLELFVDRHLVSTLNGASLMLHPPRPAETAIQTDRPWEGEFNSGAYVIHYDKLYRMYYRGLKPKGRVFLCYAESTDGVVWKKPSLGLVTVDGTSDNNIIFADCPGYDLFLDTSPATPEGERFKMVQYFAGDKPLTPYWAGKGIKTLHLFGSKDGKRFRRLTDEPIPTCDWSNAFDAHNVFFWSDVEQQYVCYFRFWDGQRTIGRMISPRSASMVKPRRHDLWRNAERTPLH